jgi:hypothetical protein
MNKLKRGRLTNGYGDTETLKGGKTVKNKEIDTDSNSDQKKK